MNRFGECGLHDRAILELRDDAHDPRTRAQSPARREHDRTGHPRTTPHHGDPSNRVLVRVAPPHGEPRPYPLGRRHERAGLALGERRESDLDGHDAARERTRRVEERAELGGAERHGHRSVHRLARHGAGLRIDAGGDVHGDDIRSEVVHRADGRGLPLTRGAAHAGTEHPVHDDAGRRQEGRPPVGLELPVPGAPDRPSMRQRIRIGPVADQHGPYVAAAGGERTERHQRVAAVVTRADEPDHDAGRVESIDDVRGAPSGALHEHPFGHADFVDRTPVPSRSLTTRERGDRPPHERSERWTHAAHGAAFPDGHASPIRGARAMILGTGCDDREGSPPREREADGRAGSTCSSGRSLGRA